MMIAILLPILGGMQILDHDIRHEVRLTGWYLTLPHQGASFEVFRAFNLDPLGSANSDLTATLSDVTFDMENIKLIPHGGHAESSLVSNLGKTWDVYLRGGSSKWEENLSGWTGGIGWYAMNIRLTFRVDEPTPFSFRHQTTGASWVTLTSTTDTIYDNIDPLYSAGNVSFVLQPDVYNFSYRSTTQFFSSHPYYDGSSSYVEFHTVPEMSVLPLFVLGACGAWGIQRHLAQKVGTFRSPQ